MDEFSITLFLLEGAAYVWDAEDWQKIRQNRIMGHFTGNLATLSRQDFFEGLPLALLPEETTLLLEKNLVRIKEVSNISRLPFEASERYRSFRDDNLAAQVDWLTDQRKQQIEQNLENIVAGKKEKRKLLKSGNNSEACDVAKQKILEEEWKKIQPPSQSSLSIQIFTGDPWISINDIEDAQWNYPTNEKEQLHYFTYRDLWLKGYYITPGGKFGVNYLVYPNDPIKFHAHFLVLCVDKRKELSFNQIVAYGRLGQSVRKTLVLAYLTDNAINYQSIQWLGM